jgi:hypothetical protein
MSEAEARTRRAFRRRTGRDPERVGHNGHSSDLIGDIYFPAL